MRFTSIAAVMSVVLGACSSVSESKAISEDAMSPATDTGQSSAESDPIDTGAYEPVAPDTGEAQTSEEDVSLPAYCDGAPAHVVCSPEINLDDWWSLEASQQFETVTGTVLSLPFTIRASDVDGGGASSTTVEGPFTDATNFRLWFSAEPGGAPLSVTSRCDNYFKQARFTVPWTQNPEHEGNERYCSLGEGPRVLYVNVEVCAHLPPDWECSDERQGDYIFNLRSSYRQW